MSGRRGLRQAWAVLFACGFAVSACTVLPKGQVQLDVGMKERGMASWYGEDFHGWLTANGEIYDMEAMTAAHRTLPLGTVIRVTNVENGRQVQVRINDRGPYLNGRVLDLSRAAARALHMLDSGVAAVQVDVVGDSQDRLGIGALLAGAQVQLTFLQAGDSAPMDVLRLAQPREVRAARTWPKDVMRERRLRRLADFQAAERRAYAAAALALT